MEKEGEHNSENMISTRKGRMHALNNNIKT